MIAVPTGPSVGSLVDTSAGLAAAAASGLSALSTHPWKYSSVKFLV